MPRQPRYALAGFPQHVIQRGNNRSPTFYAEQDYRVYLECLAEACRTHRTALHAYVLMTNHVHLLMTPGTTNGLAKVIQSVGRRYVRYINDTYRRTGTLWEGRYKASLIDTEHYLLACYRYIEMNPVRAGMVAHPADYPWSSYRHHAGLATEACIADHAQYLGLAPTPERRAVAYRALFDVHLDPAILETIRTTTNQCLVLGNDRFKDEIEQTIARRVRPGKPGRPRKEIAV
jgi:putative transposase